MTEVLVQFDSTITDPSGRTYRPRVCGGVAEDGLWEGWIEFEPLTEGATLRSPRETEQPNRADLEYWATGLTEAYLEGALERALAPETPRLQPESVEPQAAYDRPAPRTMRPPRSAPPVMRPDAVLDPFRVYAQSEHVLRSELNALSEGHLLSIIEAYQLADTTTATYRTASRAELAELIVAAVRARTR